MKKLLPFVACLGLLSGCQTAAQKHRELVNQGIAYIDESLKHGRVDLAFRYSSTLREANPSKSAVHIKDFADGSKKYVVLPVDYSNKPTLTLDSPEYNEILAQNQELKKQVAEEVEQHQKYAEKTREAVRKANEEAQRERRSGFWGWFWALGSFGTIAAAIAVCVFFPAAQPLIGSLLQSFISGVNSTVRMITNLFKKNE